MGWRFRKSFKLLPGVRIHVTHRGVSTTIGGAGLNVHLGARGAYANIGIPGTGISYRERLDVPEEPSVVEPVPKGQRVAIESASSCELASEALAQFQQLLSEAGAEQLALDRELAVVEPEAVAKTARFHRWNDGFLFKHVLKKTFHRIWTDAHETTARLAELREQRRLASVATTIEVADEQRRPFGRLCDAFSRVVDCRSIWDTLSIERADQFRQRTIAAHAIERQPVRFALGGSPLLVCEWMVPHLSNANGGDLFLYPGFVLYQVSRRSFAVVDVRDIELTVRPSHFIEEETLPSDTEVVGETWKKANKDGSPDRRFANNYRIPIARYGELWLKTRSGLNERYLVSNHAAAEQFARSWDAYAAMFSRSAS
ncbi:MAG TPA: DUF4236 domain-containing protein [Thermoanaerobaculia bacterium]|nr:DUF4236 domain-containing protein [Thermoanaerobaculia bacterium]